jgi:ABC-type oligopeptide transport system ATPase subunit
MTIGALVSPSILSLRNVSVTVPTARRDSRFGCRTLLRAMQDVTFAIPPGDAFGVVGESGCGKSTTAKAALNMGRARAGNITFQGHSILGVSDTARKPRRQRMQYVFQDPIGTHDRVVARGGAVGDPQARRCGHA